jgi:serine/threonine protein kinase
VQGEDVRRLEKKARASGQKIPLGAILRIVADVAAGLDYAHKVRDDQGQPMRLVHRDISPQNLLVGFDGGVKLIDFGVAKAAGRAQHTTTGVLKGKFPYMSPEQAEGEELDGRSDVFALGIVLWELLCEKRLFKGESDVMSQRLVRSCQVPAPSEISTHVPKALDAIVLKALTRDRDERFQTAQALREAIEQYCLEAHVPASAAHLAAFMQKLYTEKIAQLADPAKLDELPAGSDLEGFSSRVSITPGLASRRSSVVASATPEDLEAGIPTALSRTHTEAVVRADPSRS